MIRVQQTKKPLADERLRVDRSADALENDDLVLHVGHCAMPMS
jgi:hypothetical protein